MTAHIIIIVKLANQHKSCRNFIYVVDTSILAEEERSDGG